MHRSSALQPLCFFVMAAMAFAQPGFISIDCGVKRTSNYTEASGIVYSPDAGYVDGGVNVEVPKIEGYNFADRYWTMRSFPNGTRNCYTVWPVSEGDQYLLRAGFFYGNYDGTNSPPQFDLHLGVNFWQTVETRVDSTVIGEIIAVALSNTFDVCLVKSGSGTPFISVLEVRPLNDSIYQMVDDSHSLVLRQQRLDYGGNQSFRYPYDVYDRFWYPMVNGTVLSTDKDIVRPENGTRTVPLPVLKTAIVSENLSFSVTVGADEKIVVFLYFAELEELASNETREFNILFNGTLLYGPYRLSYLRGQTLYTSRFGTLTTSSYALISTSNSTRPPLLNAREVYGLRTLETSFTDVQDRDAMLKIKDTYGVRKNWQGDPCIPRKFAWQGVACSFAASVNPKIVSLNLSGSSLTGGISPSIVNLTALTSLDLSNNNLTGNIPGVLVNLQNLKVLNLANNRLNGSVPDILYSKSKSGALILNINGNTELCKAVDICQRSNKEGTETKEKKKPTVPIVVGVSVSVTLLVGTGILIWWAKERKPRTDRSDPHVPGTGNPREERSQPRNQPTQFSYQSHEFSFSDMVFITKDFGQLVGKGRFATVYHGFLNDGTEVAVKLLSKSSRGRKDFHTEGQILTRVHHKNLVRLLGYCDDKDSLALVYEYMRKGSLAEHLWRVQEGNVHLDWNTRLRIAVDVAQGLEYLHNFCKPPIIHRDIKPRNILLNEHFQAKLGDFGLSKFFSDNALHISTMVVGTPGYLDPEYYQTLNLNEKSDVYSFGIVLLEIITAQSPTGNNPREGPLLYRVKSKLERGDIENIVDKRLRGGYNPISMWKALEVAMKCCSLSSIHRPQMSEVVSELRESLESEASHEKFDRSSIQMAKSYASLIVPKAR